MHDDDRGADEAGLRGHAGRESSLPSRGIWRGSRFFRSSTPSSTSSRWPGRNSASRPARSSIPEAAQQGDYDLVVFGSPTWFFRTAMPLRSYLESDEAGKILAGKSFAVYVVCRRYWSLNLNEVKRRGTDKGGKYLDGIRFTYEGGQVRSLLSLLSYFGKGEMRERSLGIKIPPTNLKPDFGDQARTFANTLADSLDGSRTTTGGTGT